MKQGRGSEATEAVSCLMAKKPLHTGVRTGCHYLISLSVSACVTLVVFTDCASCTRPISTNPGSMEAGECGRIRGTCFIACRFEVVAVAGLLWISCWDFFAFIFVFFLRTHSACSKYEAALPHLILY